MEERLKDHNSHWNNLATRPMPDAPDIDINRLAEQIRSWGRALGFQQIGFSDTHLGEAEKHLRRWLADGFHGDMAYMERHGRKRSRPAELVPGTVSVICARMNYLPESLRAAQSTLDDPIKAYISRYALGRDYHKLLRKRLQQLADRIANTCTPFGYRVFTDSAPVLEKALAEKAGLGWIGKHSNLINREAGSWFFLGEIYTTLPLPADARAAENCGTCNACIEVCPTRAIVAPYRVDARRCISYLTIELRGSIPPELRSAIGNRIYGCDDCQMVCPWNRFATLTRESDFAPRHGLDSSQLISLFEWDEATFLSKTEGSAIRRIGYECWLRNIAVALGNAPSTAPVRRALLAKQDHPSALVREHVRWALAKHPANIETAR